MLFFSLLTQFLGYVVPFGASEILGSYRSALRYLHTRGAPFVFMLMFTAWKRCMLWPIVLIIHLVCGRELLCSSDQGTPHVWVMRHLWGK